EILDDYSQFLSHYNKIRVNKYSELITLADNAFLNQQFQLSEALYIDANEINPFETYADMQLDIIKGIARIDEKLLVKFHNNIVRADKFYEQKNFSKAKKLYSRALKFKDDAYAKGQLVSIKETISLKSILFNN
ncbi:MAG: hypothetical protein PF517_21285, partial [Salinivirgaceae bacterium]|nr:hypothetical protein [Salinivirgaceae bacterium]